MLLQAVREPGRALGQLAERQHHPLVDDRLGVRRPGRGGAVAPGDGRAPGGQRPELPDAAVRGSGPDNPGLHEGRRHREGGTAAVYGAACLAGHGPSLLPSSRLASASCVPYAERAPPRKSYC